MNNFSALVPVHSDRQVQERAGDPEFLESNGPLDLLLVFFVFLTAIKSLSATTKKVLENRGNEQRLIHSATSKSTLVHILLIISIVFVLSTIPLFILAAALPDRQAGGQVPSLLKAFDFSFQLVEYMILLGTFHVGSNIIRIHSRRIAVCLSIMTLLLWATLSFTSTLVQPLEFPALCHIMGRLDIGWSCYFKIVIFSYFILLWRRMSDSWSAVHRHRLGLTETESGSTRSESKLVHQSFAILLVSICLFSLSSLLLQLCTIPVFSPFYHNQILVKFILALLDSCSCSAIISFLLCILSSQATDPRTNAAPGHSDTSFPTAQKSLMPGLPCLAHLNQGINASVTNVKSDINVAENRPSLLYSIEYAMERDKCSRHICSTNLNSSIQLQDQATSLFRC
jgi:hypothetical protein